MKTIGDHPASPGDTAIGLTKREYFAAAAMQGMLANSDKDYSPEDEDYVGDRCVGFADALVSALNRRGISE